MLPLFLSSFLSADFHKQNRYIIINQKVSWMEEQMQGLQNYSLDADIATGWKPKMKIIGPMPLNFDNPDLDTLIKPLTHSDTSIHQVVYLGLRPRDTFQMHSFLAKNYKYKFRHLLNTDYSHLKPFFRKFYSEFEPACKMPFNGMNPRIKSTIQFQSRFESGNLDYAIRTKTNQYDLFLRIDSNTNGHIMWYYFKVNNLENRVRNLRLNICNLRRSKAFYDKGLQPYIFRKGLGWKQEANNLTVTEQRVRFYKQHLIFNNEQPTVQPNTYRKLSFDLQLKPHQQVQIAYSIPYTYSQLLQDIKSQKSQSKKLSNLEFQIDMSNISLSGLQIPYLKIYEKQENQQSSENTKKQNVLIIGRQHPGEANGSHVLKGFIQELINCGNQDKEMCQLRANFVFHVVPMLNPDGVVIGNFRTSLYGKDLNRLFRKNQTFMIPEIQFCKNLVFQITKKKKKKLFMFLDFHGHSVKKNAFCFAPSTFQTNSIEDVREFPKIISQVTQMFRFPSCSFRISNQKKTTARAVFCGDTRLCYTIQTSNWSYFSKSTKQNVLFDQMLLLELGRCLLKSLGVYISRVLQRRLVRKRRIQQKQQQKLLQHNSSSLFKVRPGKKIYIKTTTQTLQQNPSINILKQKQLKLHQSQQIPSSTRSIAETKHINLNLNIEELEKQKLGKIQTTTHLEVNKLKRQIGLFRAHQIRNIVEDFVEEELRNGQFDNSYVEKNQGKNKVMHGQGGDKDEEDGAASDDSDQSEKEDMDKEKFKKYMNGASKMFIEFQKAYYGDQYNARARYQLPKKAISTKKKQLPIMQQACLKSRNKSDRNTLQSQKLLSKLDVLQEQRRNPKKAPQSQNTNNSSNKRIKINLKQIEVEMPLHKEKEKDKEKEDILKSLPRISVVNYLAYEDIDEKKVFRIPKIQSVHIKNIRKY